MKESQKAKRHRVEQEKSRNRRNDAARMKARARRIVRSNTPARGFVMYTAAGELVCYDEWVEDCAVKCANNMAVCSCAMCGNPRRSKYNKVRLTMAERKFLDACAYNEAGWLEEA